MLIVLLGSLNTFSQQILLIEKDTNVCFNISQSKRLLVINSECEKCKEMLLNQFYIEKNDKEIIQTYKNSEEILNNMITLKENEITNQNNINIQLQKDNALYQRKLSFNKTVKNVSLIINAVLLGLYGSTYLLK
jgi:hypothetical protein